MVTLSGRGLHGGKAATVTFVREPGPLRLELPGAGGARPLRDFEVVGTFGATHLRLAGSTVARTVEHLFAALAGLGVRDGLRVVLSGADEMPLLDGGAATFARALETSGFALLASAAPPLAVARTATVDVEGSLYAFAPGHGDAVRVEVDVELPSHCASTATWSGDATDFVARIAPARTFVLEHDVEEMARRGLAQHVDPTSVVIVGETSLHGSGIVPPDEPARHKLLDLVGDAFAHGGPPRGVLRAFRPGHGRTHVAIRRAIAEGILVLRAATAVVVAAGVLTATAPAAHADDDRIPARPPTLPELTHRAPDITLEDMLASVTYNDGAVQGTTYVRVERLSFEMPIGHSNWYAGVAYDAALGHDDDGAPRLLSGNPELFGRGVWSSAYGLSFGGGLSVVAPTKSYATTDVAASTAYAAIAARGWDRALFDPDNMTLRPFLDVRLLTGPITVQYRQSLELATDFSSYRFAAVGTVYFGVRFSPLLSAGLDLIEYYRLESSLDDDARPYFAIGAHVRIDTRHYQPTIGIMTNIGSPLNALSRLGAPLGRAPTSFIGVHFGLSFSP